jgi:hypothetical protein
VSPSEGPRAGGLAGHAPGVLMLPARMVGYLRAGLWVEHGGVCAQLAELSLCRERDPERRERLRMDLAGLWALFDLVGWEQPDAQATRVSVRSYGGLLCRALERQLEVELDALEDTHDNVAQHGRVKELRGFIARLGLLEPGSFSGVPERGRRVARSGGRVSGSGVRIELTDGQLQAVMREAVESNAQQERLADLDLSGPALSTAAGRALLSARHGGSGTLSAGLMRGLLVFSAFREGKAERGVSEIARELQMSINTVHVYVRTLVAIGLLHPVSRSRLYRREP